MTDFARVPPHNLDAEIGLLGAIILDASCLARVRADLLPEHFYRDGHRLIYEALCELVDADRAVSLIVLIDHLEKSGDIERVGGIAALSGIEDAGVTGALVDSYARIVREKYAARLLTRSYPDDMAPGELAKQREADQRAAKRALGAAKKEPTGKADDRPAEAPDPGTSATDQANAERLVAQHGANMRYCHPWGSWLIWNGQRWERDQTAAVLRMAKATVRSIYAEAADGDSKKEREAIARHAMKSESARALVAMVKLAESEPKIPILPAEMDVDLWALNVENGTLDLRAGELKPHAREDKLTKLAPVAHSSTAEAPLWKAFLERVQPDPEVREFLQRSVGYSLTGTVGEHCLWFLYGGGRNGKGTFIETIRWILGEYASEVDPSILLERRNDSGSLAKKIVDLFGARFVSTIEVAKGERLATGITKTITGGNTLRGQRHYQEKFDFAPTHKVWFAANDKPVIRETDEGIWSRIHLVPFTVFIPPADRDRALYEKLRGEAPGILRWAVAGCLAWQREGLRPPATVRAATDSYRDEMDVVKAWIDDSCGRGDTLSAGATELYQNYVSWCERGHERTMSQRSFGRELGARGFKSVRTRIGYRWHGLSLLSANDISREPCERCDTTSQHLSYSLPHEDDFTTIRSHRSQGSRNPDDDMEV